MKINSTNKNMTISKRREIQVKKDRYLGGELVEDCGSKVEVESKIFLVNKALDKKNFFCIKMAKGKKPVLNKKVLRYTKYQIL